MVERRLLDKLIDAFEGGDVEGIVSLLTEDAWVRMPPVPLEYQGRELARRFLVTVAFREGRCFRLVPIRANGQPGFGVYLQHRASDIAHIFGLFVITLAGEKISATNRVDNSVIASGQRHAPNCRALRLGRNPAGQGQLHGLPLAAIQQRLAEWWPTMLGSLVMLEV